MKYYKNLSSFSLLSSSDTTKISPGSNIGEVLLRGMEPQKPVEPNPPMPHFVYPNKPDSDILSNFTSKFFIITS